MEAMFETRSLSSLAKVFPDEELKEEAFLKASAFLNETYTFQVAYRQKESRMHKVKIRVEGKLSDLVEVRAVGLVPSELPVYHDHDENVLRTTPGLYPDPLHPLENGKLPAPPNQWRSAWVTVELNEELASGIYPIKVIFETESGEQLGEEIFELELLTIALPEQKLINTHWFHSDCLATQYNVEVFSEKHWQLIDRYIQTAAKHGMNMLLTPLFTPPLDTEVGGERPTVQLVEVEKTEDGYRFDFNKLTRWIEMATERGIKYIEFSHLFTQWGANHAPKIIASENGETSKIFGWETDAAGEEYKAFLAEFLPALIDYIKEQRLEESVYFHVSDEPNLSNLDSYKQASEIIHHYLSEFPIIDALSDYQFYEKGLVKNPIPANDHIGSFIENDVPDLWTYYCCAQNQKVSNRFFAFPSARNRISGIQFYKFNITGFLHWGYNFWNSQLSKRQIDPFHVTDADLAFPSGDAFLVYPGEEGPIESIRMEVFYEALQDLRALQLLEKLAGREQVLEIIESSLAQSLTFTEYPHDSRWLLIIREKINKKITELSIKEKIK
ncbi:hypothetical protein CIL05_00360 [Virgibacillus profundi]|uniref:Glycoside hydrolase 123 catalytic domain-containing protein n=1 Tax=Virgibacillus profundi TaxID=2024555 RepID=A0A2A2IIE6_9BACI|nr:DUF4091 domain-containing protein [Virgibacillus profundi]PAV31148.1 hypothetical protein CIL05_00360 [Virgibacillus profundi]PXY55331.1 DUF4091 domain-containing protein [Virgibacillus profundi]